MTLRAEGVGVRVSGHWLIEDIDADITPGEILVVLGPNGAGKSTLLSALAGDRAVDAGAVRFGDRSVAEMPLGELARRRAVVGPSANLAFDYTVRDVIEMGWRDDKGHEGIAKETALAAVAAECELEQLLARIYMTLSSGERQRVQFARSLLQIWRPPDDTSPRWILLDEPTANLDIAYGIRLLTSLRQQAERGIGVLAILHDLNLGARFADRTLLLCNGRAAAHGTPREVMTSETLSDVYRTPVHVEHNAHLDRLVALT